MKKERKLTVIENKEENNVVDLATRKAFGDGIGGNEDWLSELALGTVFVARPKVKLGEKLDPMQRLILNPYFIQEVHEDIMNLLWRTPEGKQLDIWVRTIEFSRLMEKVKVIGLIVPDRDTPVDNAT